MTAQCAPYMGALKIFGTPWLCSKLLFPKIHGFLFWLTLWMCEQNMKSVALPVPELIGFSQKIGGGSWLCSHSLSPPPQKKIPYAYHTDYLSTYTVHSFSRYFRWQFWVGIANPQSWGRGGHRWSGMVPFKRALVSSYRLPWRGKAQIPHTIAALHLFGYRFQYPRLYFRKSNSSQISSQISRMSVQLQ